MSGVITISGHSDDLIHVEGTITEELLANFDKPTTVWVGPWAFEVSYNDRGEWEILLESAATGESMKKWAVGGHPDYNDYTQVVQIPGHSEYEVRSE